MDTRKFNNIYWRYYKVLENDFMATTRFVELDERNFKTFSVEYIKQYQAVCSEIDVISKEICKFYGNDKVENMKEYTNVILPKHNDLKTRVVFLKYLPELELRPFKDWKADPSYKSPDWWGEYNDVKHARSRYINKANLGNVIQSLAGLYLLEMYFIYDIAEKLSEEMNVPDTSSSLFEIKDWKSNIKVVQKGVIIT